MVEFEGHRTHSSLAKIRDKAGGLKYADLRGQLRGQALNMSSAVGLGAKKLESSDLNSHQTLEKHTEDPERVEFYRSTHRPAKCDSPNVVIKQSNLKGQHVFPAGKRGSTKSRDMFNHSSLSSTADLAGASNQGSTNAHAHFQRGAGRSKTGHAFMASTQLDQFLRANVSVINTSRLVTERKVDNSPPYQDRQRYSKKRLDVARQLRCQSLMQG